MILPTKRLNSNRSLLAIGGTTLKLLTRSKSVSILWDDFKKARGNQENLSYITYDWFILSLDLLYLLNLIKLESGRISKTNDQKSI